MNKGLKMFSRSLLAGLMVLAIAPISATKVFAEDATTTTTETTSTTDTTTNTDPKNIQVNSDTITADSTGKEVEKKDTTITTVGTSEEGTVTDTTGNKAEVVSGTATPASTVTLDANGNPVDTRESTDTTSKTETASTTTTTATDTTTTTTTTVTDTTVKTTETTSVDQQAIDAAGKEENNTLAAETTSSTYEENNMSVDGVTYSWYVVDASGNKVDSSHYRKNYKTDTIIVDVTIGEKGEDQVSDTMGDQTAQLGMVATYLASKFRVYSAPGDVYKIQFNIDTATGNKHVYEYKDGSLYISAQDQSGTDTTTDASDVKGFDNQYIPNYSIGTVTNSPEIQKLLGKTASEIRSNPYLLLGITDALKANGYSSLSEYFLKEFNAKYKTNYSTFDEMIQKDQPNSFYFMFGSAIDFSNNFVSIKIEDTKVQEIKEKYSEEFAKGYLYLNEIYNGHYLEFKWPDAQVAAVSYNYFYNNLLKTYYGDNADVKALSNTKMADVSDYSIGQYYTDPELLKAANEYFNNRGLIGNGNTSNYKNINFYIGLDARISPAYSDQDFSIYSDVKFTQIDGGVSVTKVDDAGNTITNDETGFVLYRLDNDVKNYYSVDENGNVSLTTDFSKASKLTTTKGVLNINYLMPGEYGLMEVSAPQGYYINSTDQLFSINSDSITKLMFADIKPITVTSTNQETTTTVTKTVSSVTRPIVTPTTNNDPEPTRPGTTPKTSDTTTPTTTTTTTTATTNTTRAATPRTGDETNVPYAAGGFAVSMLVALMAVLLKKKVTE